MNLRAWLHRIFDRHRNGSWGVLTTGPLDEQPPPTRPYDAARPRRMDEPRPRDEGGLTWDHGTDD